MSQESILYGPSDFAEKIIGYREERKVVFDTVRGQGPILHDKDIRDIVQFTYHASLMPEEGRYPRFRIVVSDTSFGYGIKLSDTWLGHQIDSPDSLRRLAPAIAGRSTALLVHTGNRGLIAWRIVDFERFCAGPPVDSNRLSDTPVLQGGMLFLRVDGPGNLRAMIHPSPIFHLRGGEIRFLNSCYTTVEPFKILLVDLCTALHHSVKGEKRVEYYVPEPGIFADDFADLWAASLAVAIEGRHGGAFAVVPSPDCPHLKVKYKTEGGGLFSVFEETLRHCLDSTEPSGPGYLWKFKLYWQSQQYHLRRAARLLGQLGATDGCVVLDRRLDLKGFGAKIDWPHDATFLPLIDARNGQQITEEQIEQGMGTRHRSACRLAQVLPGTIVFVISQDGDLTVFYSNESRAYRMTHLDAWSSISAVV